MNDTLTQGKALIHSTAFWLAAAQFVVAIIVAVQSYLGAYVPGDVIAVLLGLKSVIDVVVRSTTTQPITSVLPPTPTQ